MPLELIKTNAARKALAEARSIDEVKDIRDKAEAVRLYAKQAGYGLEMINDAAEIKLRAERKAGEMLAVMEKQNGARGVGKKVELQRETPLPTTLEDMGVSKTQSHRWQQVAAIPEAEFDQYVAETKSEQRELTTSGMMNLTANGKPHVAHNSGENEWYTPAEYIAAARQVMGEIDLDPASSKIANRTVKAKHYYDKQSDGLVQEWRGRVWLNPPYAGELIGLFCDKLADSVECNTVTEALVLVNNATETGWFGRLVGVARAIVFTRARVRFLDPDGNPGAPLQGQAIVYIGPRVDLFLDEFKSFGWGARL